MEEPTKVTNQALTIPYYKTMFDVESKIEVALILEEKPNITIVEEHTKTYRTKSPIPNEVPFFSIKVQAKPVFSPKKDRPLN